MTCQHPGCLLEIFDSCTNHCMLNVCLAHLIEHGDMFLHDFTDLLERIERSVDYLLETTGNTPMQVNERRRYEIERINGLFDREQQAIQRRYSLAEVATTILKEKHHRLSRAKQNHEYLVDQHDFEQIKIYQIQIEKCLAEKQQHIPNFEDIENEEETNCALVLGSPETINHRPRKSYACPLTRPNVFGIRIEHNIPFDCHASGLAGRSLCKHFMQYHRMTSECAIRMKNAVIAGQPPDQTNLFADDPIILDPFHFIDCPLTDSENVFGARTSLHALVHLPCTKKRLSLHLMMSHFRDYHNMKYKAARMIVKMLRAKTLTPDTILFAENERIGLPWKKL